MKTVEMERKIYVQEELIEEMGIEFFKGLDTADLAFTTQGLQDGGFFLEMDDYGIIIVIWMNLMVVILNYE